MRRTAGWLMLVLVGAAGAQELDSLVDPKVTLTVTDEPLQTVLQEVTDQTGVSFHALGGRAFQAGAFMPDRPGDFGAGGGELNPHVSIEATDEPLRAVLSGLEETAPVRFQPLGLSAYQVMPAQPRGVPDEAMPRTAVGDYSISLRGVRTERVNERYWGGGEAGGRRSTLEAMVDVACRTNLAQIALRGIDGGVAAQMDDQPLTLVAGGDGAARPGQPDAGLAPTRYHVTYQAPEQDGRHLDLSGGLQVRREVTEHLFRYQDLDTPDQMLTEGEIDVTLKSWTHTEGPAEGQDPVDIAMNVAGVRFTRGGNMGPGYLAELVVSRPLTPALREMMTTGATMNLPQQVLALGPNGALVDFFGADGMMGWMPQIAGAMPGFDGLAAMNQGLFVMPGGGGQVELNIQADAAGGRRRVIIRRQQDGQEQVEVQEMQVGPPPAGGAGAPAVEAPMAPQVPGALAAPAQPLLPQWRGQMPANIDQRFRQAMEAGANFARQFVGAGTGWNATQPLATYETPIGVRRAGTVIAVNAEPQGDERLVQTYRVFFPAEELLDPALLYVSLLDFGDEVATEPFAFDQIALGAE